LETVFCTPVTSVQCKIRT